MIPRVFRFVMTVAFLASTPAIAQEKQTSKQAVEKRLKKIEKDQASPAIAQAIHAIGAATSFAQVAISPDGKKVAWVEELRGKNGNDSGNSAIFVSTLDGKSAVRKITASPAAPRSEHDIAWSPDSRRVAFISDALKPGQSQLYLESAP